MTTTSGQNTELAKPIARVVYFAEFHFTNGIVRVSTLGQDYTWGGYTWVGVGAIGSISEIVETSTVTSSPVNFTLNITSSALFALAVNTPDTYRGQAAKLYMCPLNENFQLVDTPVICWRGYMDMMAVNISPTGEGSITMKCETSAYGLTKMPNLRMNAQQQKLKYPTDTGFDYLTYLITQPQIWFSATAQGIIFHK